MKLRIGQHLRPVKQTRPREFFEEGITGLQQRESLFDAVVQRWGSDC